MTEELVKVTIDGVELAVAKGTTIIEAAKQAGVLVPHYCYHPSLPSPAVCRMCLVEVEKAPKLMPACVTTVAEGNVIHVNSQSAKRARESVLEFLLINHPLDCPICDQAGECELQDYVFQEGQAGTRYGDYAKRFNPVEDFGPDVLYVPNRCILCTRCVRFMDSVAEEPVLNVSERGDRAYIGIDPEQPLDHPWSGNVVDLCPVGSLISKDFLHKARAWDLDKTASICPGCTQGCNIMVDTRDEVVVRLRPRPNLDVNRHFICDEGRAGYRWMNRGDRVEAPVVRSGAGRAAVDWDAAVDALAGVVREVGAGSTVLLASGRASLESLGWTARLLADTRLTAAIRVPTGAEAPLAGISDLALRAERVPNLDGARLAGYSADFDGALRAAGSAALVVLLDVELSDDERSRLGGAGRVVAITTVDDDAAAGATITLPTTSMVEESGTYLNRDRRVQRYHQARSAPGMARPAWWIASEANAALRGDAAPATPAEAFAALGGWLPALAGLDYQALGFTGKVVDLASSGAAR
ncbi:MAG: 2Fe-2S iron-sulfur cluster-binding protein [Gemmatimonadales bacterium]